MDSDSFLRDFQTDYYNSEGGKFNLTIQVPHLVRLADCYREKYRITNHWTDCLKAHSLYISAYTRAPEDEQLLSQAFNIQEEYWKGSADVTRSQYFNLVEELKTKLTLIRADITEKVEKVSVGSTAALFDENKHGYQHIALEAFCDSINEVSVDCTSRMIGLARMIMAQSVSIMNEVPPCPFAVVAMGSLARGEATPYSDLEYLFLIEEKNPATETFFENIAMTSYFLIGSLGETKLSYMNIDELYGWFDDRSTNGVKIDGLTADAGNIPTGNGKTHKNRFIITPQELLTKYQAILDNPNEELAIRGDFTAMLTYMQIIYSYDGGENLLENLIPSKAKVRPSVRRATMNEKMLQTDLKKFNFKPHSDLCNKGYTLDVKKELYRFPSILLLDLAIIYDCPGDTSWQTLRNLFRNKCISRKVLISLRFLLSCACYIRMAAYLHHGSHDDRVSVARRSLLDTNPLLGANTSRQQQGRWFVSNKLFTALCEHLLPLRKLLIGSSNFKEDLALSENLVSDWYTEIQYLYFLGRYRDALDTANRQLRMQIQDHPADALTKIFRIGLEDRWDMIKMAADILYRSYEYKAALFFYKWLGDHNIQHEWLNIAQCYLQLGMLNKASQVLSGIQAASSRKSAGVCLTLGNLHQKQGYYKYAEQYFLQALQLYHDDQSREQLCDYYGYPILPISIRVCREKNDLAKMSPMKRLDNVINITTDIINCIIALGRIYRIRGDYMWAEKHFWKSKKMLATLYGDEALVPLSATVYNSLGITLKTLKRYQDANTCYKKAHAILIDIYRPGAINEDIADVMFNMALNTSAKGENNIAYPLMEKALNMYKTLSPSHPQVAKCQRMLAPAKIFDIGFFVFLILVAGIFIIFLPFIQRI